MISAHGNCQHPYPGKWKEGGDPPTFKNKTGFLAKAAREQLTISLSYSQDVWFAYGLPRIKIIALSHMSKKEVAICLSVIRCSATHVLVLVSWLLLPCAVYCGNNLNFWRGQWPRTDNKQADLPVRGALAAKYVTMIDRKSEGLSWHLESHPCLLLLWMLQKRIARQR